MHKLNSMRVLAEKEREVLELFFGLKNQHAHSLEEIGEKYHLTRERVRQIKDKALERLRHSTHSRTLKTYLG
jgi:RNA polymerase primary sigma factor